MIGVSEDCFDHTLLTARLPTPFFASFFSFSRFSPTPSPPWSNTLHSSRPPPPLLMSRQTVSPHPPEAHTINGQLHPQSIIASSRDIDDIPLDPALFVIEEVVNDVRRGKIRLHEHGQAVNAETRAVPAASEAIEGHAISLDEDGIDPALREIVDSLTNAQQVSTLFCLHASYESCRGTDAIGKSRLRVSVSDRDSRMRRRPLQLAHTSRTTRRANSDSSVPSRPRWMIWLRRALVSLTATLRST